MQLNFPDQLKMYTANIVPPPSLVAIGFTCWGLMHIDWVATYWESWVKPQIDTAIALGCNGIRMIGDFSQIFAGNLTQSAYNANWAQLIDYCSARGVCVVVTGGGWNQTAGMSNADIGGIVVSLLGALSSRRNIAYVDVLQEANDSGSNSARVNAIADIVKPTTSLPITFSITERVDQNDSSGWAAAIATRLDLYDFHIYKALGYDGFNPVTSAMLNYWQGKPICFGECGTPSTDGTESGAFLSSLFRLCQRDARLRSVGQWSIFDQSTSDDMKFGFHDSNGVPRTALRNAVRGVTGGFTARLN